MSEKIVKARGLHQAEILREINRSGSFLAVSHADKVAALRMHDNGDLSRCKGDPHRYKLRWPNAEVRV